MKRSSSEEGPRPENFPIGSAESRAAARALVAARQRECEIVEISCLGVPGGSAKYRVEGTGLKLIEGDWPTQEQFNLAYKSSQSERFDPKSLIGGAESLPRCEETPQPQCKFEKPVTQKVPIDPLAAVHRRSR